MDFELSPKLIALTLICLVVAYWCYHKIIFPYYLGPYSHLPRHPNGLIHYFKLVYHRSRGNHRYMQELSQEYGPVVHLVKNWVLVNDPAIRKHWSTYQFPKSYYYRVFNITGPNLFSTFDKTFHMNRKKLILPAFIKKNLKLMDCKIFQIGSSNLIQFINQKLIEGDTQVFDLYHLFQCSALDVIGALVIGEELNTIMDREKADYYFRQIALTETTLFLRSLLPWFTKISHPMVTLFRPFIEENLRQRRVNNIRQDDILQSLMDSVDSETGERLSDVDILDECIMLLFAGMDTTANTLTWTLYEILRHPKVYNLIKEEVLEHFPDLDAPITTTDCENKLRYLEAAIMESLRMHPVTGDGLPRRVPEGGITVGDYYLPEKTVITMQVYTQHNNPQTWADPQKFNIERWLGSEREMNISKLMSFGVGPRSCIGRDLAWSEIYMVITNLIRNFELELIDRKLTPHSKFLYKPRELRMKVRIEPRN